MGGLHEVLQCKRDKAARVVVMVTGNPGLPAFYAGFADELSESMEYGTSCLDRSRPQQFSW